MDLAENEQAERSRRIVLAAALVAVFLAATIAYWPGLAGPFLLDDFGAIAALGNYGGIRDWETFRSFVFRGHAGPTGRPLSLLTFLIDSRNWPADPWPFKRTNLVIHLINGALLAVLMRQLLTALHMDRRKAFWLALISMGCWLLHPFLVSTTLYVVQRMAQLAALFIFLGLIGYVYGRSLLDKNAFRAYLVMSASLGIGTVLALLCKENGILLPLLAGTLELTVFASHKAGATRLNRLWVWLFIVAPSAVVFLYLTYYAANADFYSIVPPRNYSLFERLLTQPRVLIDYLQNWYIPKLYTTGIFQDHFSKSTGLFAPVSTALSILFHAALVGIALAKRRQWPLFSLAVLFFYGGHVLESTVLNLELYFEHRNYVSAGFLFLPVVAIIQEKIRPKTFLLVSAGILLLLGSFTRYSATVWQSLPSIVEASARKAPTSARAQGRYATDLFNAGRLEESLEVLDRAIGKVSNEHPLLNITRPNILCHGGTLTREEFDRVMGGLEGTHYDPRAIRLYTALLESIIEERCPDVTVDAVHAMFVRMLDLPRNADPTSLAYSHIKYFIGFTEIYRHDPDAAIAAFEESLAARPGASHALMMAALLATSEYYEESLYLSEMAMTQLEDDRRSTIVGNRVTEADIERFKATVRADLDALQDGDTSDQVE